MAGTRGTYRKTAQRREQILEAAFAIFAKNGYTASSVNEIARAVGITQTGVLHHFAGGKLALLTAVLQQRDALAEENLRGKTGREFLAALVEISRVQAGQRGVVQLYRNLSTEAVDPEHPAHNYFRERLGRIIEAVTQAFSEVLAEDGLKPGIEPRAAALNTLAMTEGLETLWLQGLDVDMAEGIRWHINGFLAKPL
ncbi:TetR/AcrR family transcriptional regulator [Glutamicibacter halophytocola]|uniref:TetR/AcrR family transcriptional regulator n=1 Tax=Glutamicibacter halophytocola TaxID=1933880 RepID=A0A5B8IX35_9MICC|nr:TetR/AcrR family transcriptional regulator [Glutamicibacter halophytocola]QDY66647.1 TetR/AcrR family transcriptional regulator [Glutamicibacter halophytocola]UUX58768.1 TetR/AcrR family transcriptional regulator [Glutamicibacter halophytocola]